MRLGVRTFAGSTTKKLWYILPTLLLTLAIYCLLGASPSHAQGQHSVVASWMPSTTPSVTYNVYRGTAADMETSSPLNPMPVAALTFTDTTVKGGTTYFYVVRSFDGISESVNSNEVLAVIPADLPPPPPPKYAPGDTFKVITSGARLNVRQAADPTAPVINSLSNGQLGTITGPLANGYWQISLGFVSDQFIRQ